MISCLDEPNNDEEEQREQERKDKIRKMNMEQLRASHQGPWVKSTKIPEIEYLPNLKVNLLNT